MLGNFLSSQKIQAPFQLPTNWLCVGHVDQFATFVPAPGTAKGFKLVIADTKAAYTMLASLSSSATLTKYGADHGYATVGAILAVRRHDTTHATSACARDERFMARPRECGADRDARVVATAARRADSARAGGHASAVRALHVRRDP